MIDKKIYAIFKEGSKTYFYSSLFFPSYIKKEVFSLYAFVRKADNYVDSLPQNIPNFYRFKEKYEEAINGHKTNDIVVDSFVELVIKKEFSHEWVESFLKSMEMDITKDSYKNIDETIEYIHGSAEVIGLMMSKILNLPKESYINAKYLGRAMQYINFIRDIAEDRTLGRNYFPRDELKKFGLENLNYEHTIKNKEKFQDFIKCQLNRYLEWQKKAEEGYKFIPKRYLIPVKTASEMYNWTATQIYKDPFVVYTKKVKPMLNQIISTTVMNVIDPKKPNHRLKLCTMQKPINQISY